MVSLILIFTHAVFCMAFFLLPELPKRTLFGVAVPEGFRAGPEGRRAVARYRYTVGGVILATSTALAWWSRGSLSPGWILLPFSVAVAGMAAFAWQHARLSPYGVAPSAVREIEVGEPEEGLPAQAWLAAIPVALLIAAAAYLAVHYDAIPQRYPVHFNAAGQADRFAERSLHDVFGPLIFALAIVVSMFVTGVTIWFGARRSEPLRKPTFLVLMCVQTALVVIFAGAALRPLLAAPRGASALVFGALIVVPVLYTLRVARRSESAPDLTPNDCWKGGMLYYNPADAALYVGRRAGVGLTPNFGRPQIWALLAGLVLVLASGPLLLP